MPPRFDSFPSSWSSELTADTPGASPGKRALTQRMARATPPEPSIVSRPPGVPVQRQLDPALAAVQRKQQDHDAAASMGFFGGPADTVEDSIHAYAAAGVSGAGQSLPHLDAIQRSFGPHDVSSVRAHVGGAAAEASDAIGAHAYATGNDVAFASQPDLFLAAHEAAHVVQQRQGVSLKSSVGEAGDAYEQHADEVAAAVVRGESVAELLGASPGSAGDSAVQMKGKGKGKGKKPASDQTPVGGGPMPDDEDRELEEWSMENPAELLGWIETWHEQALAHALASAAYAAANAAEAAAVIRKTKDKSILGDVINGAVSNSIGNVIADQVVDKVKDAMLRRAAKASAKAAASAVAGGVTAAGAALGPVGLVTCFVVGVAIETVAGMLYDYMTNTDLQDDIETSVIVSQINAQIFTKAMTSLPTKLSELDATKATLTKQLGERPESAGDLYAEIQGALDVMKPVDPTDRSPAKQQLATLALDNAAMPTKAVNAMDQETWEAAARYGGVYDNVGPRLFLRQCELHWAKNGIDAAGALADLDKIDIHDPNCDIAPGKHFGRKVDWRRYTLPRADMFKFADLLRRVAKNNFALGSTNLGEARFAHVAIQAHNGTAKLSVVLDATTTDKTCAIDEFEYSLTFQNDDGTESTMTFTAIPGD